MSFNEEELRNFAAKVRKRIIFATFRAGVSHIGGSLSVVEILTCLFNGILNVTRENLTSRDRDQFVLSKGHAGLALYAVLAEKGFLDDNLFWEYGCVGETLLGIHPELGVPGIDAATGSLGHGLPLGVGCALAFVMHRKPFHVFVLVGDGELNEGTNWECLPIALRYGLDNLTLIVDRNRLQLSGFTEDLHPLEPLVAKFEAFGWTVREVAGHDLWAVWEALSWAKGRNDRRPAVILAQTVKGKGVPELENEIASHYCGLPREIVEKYVG
ncbi:MAG: transketolase [Candidatus Caldatribacterium sp.]|uniref:transketolase n=1 Tax=Candidatus Caldatribacterium sp. TaxID=2282143 RepID=UPI00299B4D04|nr:transketolase [Candidatus Caldatribacterium sp.]MCX7730359.1 transketolase [Candidatus Caldatribacterium sp.]MDW8080643.1 transketolase [Candidatus Calescibacterium sp.]